MNQEFNDVSKLNAEQKAARLAYLLADMNAKNEALKKVTRRNALAAFKSPEYVAAKAAYRLYWAAVDSSK